MIRKILFTSILCLLLTMQSQAQNVHVEVLTSGTRTSLRGLSVVNDNVIWVSGSGGMVGKSSTGGKSWKWMTVKGFEKAEFRDIEAFDANTAVIMAIAEPAYILKTTDGGDTWRVVYENKNKGMFLDAMDFSSSKDGIVIGDPIDGKPFIATTDDSGNTWTEKQTIATVDSGEAFFAASGTNIRLFDHGKYFMVSGGKRSRLITNEGATVLPIVQGKETTGANSIDIFDNGIAEKPGNHMIVVGGDFNADSASKNICFVSHNGGKTWQEPKVPPHGYRSCVEYLSKKDLIACGLNGVDFSNDGGRNWKWISKEGFHVCRIAKIGSAVFLAGGNGKIAKLVFD